ncbi:MAG: DUF2207 family protein, partial [Actinomycetota bacterium]
ADAPPVMKRALLFVAVVVAVLAIAAPASAKSFTIPRLEVEAELHPDGSMDVVERFTYDFDGVFNVGTRYIEPGDYYEVVDMRATENGEPRPTLIADPSSFEWDLGGATGVHVYEVTYRVVGAAQVGPDVAELEWLWVGRDFPALGELDVMLTVPGDGTGVRAWGHGPLDGEVRPEGNVVRFTVDGVPAGQFVEGRVAVPTESFTVAPEGGPRLPGILEEEQERADEANAQRNRVKALNLASPVVALLGFVAFIVIWARWGNDPPRPDDIGDYWREIPEDPPAVVTSMLTFARQPDATAFAATVVDLAQRGFLTITEARQDRLLLPDKTDFRFERKDGADSVPGRQNDQLLPYERKVLDRLFATGDVTTQSELIDWAKSAPTTANSFWTGFQSAVKADIKGRDYIAPGRAAAYGFQALNVLAVGAFGVLALSQFAIGGILCLVAAVMLVPFSLLLRKKTEVGTRRVTEWQALRSFLKDFSLLDEAPIGHMALWERYLVYAVALDVADELVEGLRLKVPEIASGTTSFAPWYVGMPGTHVGGGANGIGSIASIGSFASSFGSATTAAFSPQSSGSGGGGGFSGGGGGGGGGGGAGAR